MKNTMVKMHKPKHSYAWSVHNDSPRCADDGRRLFNKEYGGSHMIYQWELDKIKNWTTNEIKNSIWSSVDCGQPIQGCVSIDALRKELVNRGKEPIGYHDT